jgi:hypothetical protein
MADITLKGTLNLTGNLTFKPGGGGKVKVGSLEALVQITPSDPAQCSSAPPVMLPPPPAGPAFPQPTVWIVSSFNQTVKAQTKAIVALGMVMQGQNGAPWPGMMLPSSGNPTVKINNIPINVVNDQAVIFPSGGSAAFSTSGQ